MRWLGPKLIQGLTCSAVSIVAAGLMCELVGIGYGAGGALIVGLPTLMGGMLLFPISQRTLQSRGRFTSLGAALGLICSATHHVYWFGAAAMALSMESRGAELPRSWSPEWVLTIALQWMHPTSIARAYGRIHCPMVTYEVIGVAVAATCAFALQPALARLVGVANLSQVP